MRLKQIADPLYHAAFFIFLTRGWLWSMVGDWQGNRRNIPRSRRIWACLKGRRNELPLAGRLENRSLKDCKARQSSGICKDNACGISAFVKQLQSGEVRG